MTNTGTAITVTTHTAVAVADELNRRFFAGALATVNGRDVKLVGSRVATSWQNGTVSVTVQGRDKGATGTVYTKTGQTLTVA